MAGVAHSVPPLNPSHHPTYPTIQNNKPLYQPAPHDQRVECRVARLVSGRVVAAVRPSSHSPQIPLHPTTPSVFTPKRPLPHVQRVECRVSRLIRCRVVAAVCLVSVHLALLAHVVEVLPRVALTLHSSESKLNFKYVVLSSNIGLLAYVMEVLPPVALALQSSDLKFDIQMCDAEFESSSTAQGPSGPCSGSAGACGTHPAQQWTSLVVLWTKLRIRNRYQVKTIHEASN